MSELKPGCPKVTGLISTTSIEIDADVSNLACIGEFIRENAELAGFNEKDVCAIELAVDEMVSNAIIHGYGEQGVGKVTVKAGVLKGGLMITIEEGGRDFDPFTMAEPDIEASLSDRKIGGLGLFLVKQIMDEFYFEKTEENTKRFYLLKRLSADN